MKSSSTMLAMARARAVELGPRIWEGRRCGVFLTVAELKAIYDDAGFNWKGSAMRRHVEQWMGCSLVAAEGPLAAPRSAIWFDCPEEMRTRMAMLSEGCGGRRVETVIPAEWPSLRRAHGLQEASA